MKVEIINVSVKSGEKDGKSWVLSNVHIKTDKGDIVELQIWKAVTVPVGSIATLVFEGRYNYKTRQFFGVPSDLV